MVGRVRRGNVAQSGYEQKTRQYGNVDRSRHAVRLPHVSNVRNGSKADIRHVGFPAAPSTHRARVRLAAGPGAGPDGLVRDSRALAVVRLAALAQLFAVALEQAIYLTRQILRRLNALAQGRLRALYL